MKKVKIALISLFFFAAPTLVHAQPAPKVVTLAKDQKAPFAGTLLNPAAAAHTIAEKESVVNQCKLAKQYVEQKEVAKCDLLTKIAETRIESLRLERDSIMGIKDEEIERLRKMALDRPNRHNHWWFAGGVVTGIVTSIAIFYASVEVAK
jgi:hypothetical protein